MIFGSLATKKKRTRTGSLAYRVHAYILFKFGSRADELGSFTVSCQIRGHGSVDGNSKSVQLLLSFMKTKGTQYTVDTCLYDAKLYLSRISTDISECAFQRYYPGNLIFLMTARNHIPHFHFSHVVYRVFFSMEEICNFLSRDCDRHGLWVQSFQANDHILPFVWAKAYEDSSDKQLEWLYYTDTLLFLLIH